MDKILETMIHGLISRIETLEKEVKELKEGKTTSSPNRSKEIKNPNEPASEGQRNFLINLGVEIADKLTKMEAHTLIKETLKKRDREKAQGGYTPKKSAQDKEITTKSEAEKEADEVLDQYKQEPSDQFDEEGAYL